MSATAARHVRLFARLADWLSVEGVRADDLTTGLIDRFFAADRRPGQRWPSTRSLVPLLAFLRGEGVVISAETVQGWTAEVLTGFRRHLVCERGLCSSTVQSYVWFAGLFLAAMPDSVQVDLGLVTAADVTSAVCSCLRVAQRWLGQELRDGGPVSVAVRASGWPHPVWI